MPVNSVIEAGKDPSKCVTITLPNDYEPYLKIRDEGLGLSEADFRRIFRKYGASTKRDSNETIGCLGIGSKSAFSYSDTYTVTAIKQGIKRVFIASVARDSVAKDGVGNLNRVLEIDTEEPNGVEISIPVKSSDFNDFYNKVCDFLSFIPVDQRPIVRGINQSLVTIPVRDGEYKGANWTLTGNGYSYAIMGGVPYNLDVRSMDLLTEQEKELLELGVDMVFPIGSFEFAISREEVRYTELSQNAIKAELQKIITILADEISKKFNSATNIWEAKYAYHRVNHGGGIDSKLIRKVFNDAQKIFLNWNGQPVTNSSFVSKGQMVIFSCALAWDGKLDKAAVNSIDAKLPKIPLIVIHEAKRYGEWQRVLSALKKLKADFPNEAAQCFLIRFDDKPAKDEFYNLYDFASLPSINLSSYERDRSQSKAGRQYSRTFTFDYVGKTVTREGQWTAADCDLDVGGFYVEIKKNFYAEHPTSHVSVTPDNLNDMIQELKKMGHNVDGVWGFKSSVALKCDKTKWTNIISFFASETSKYLIANAAFQYGEDETAFQEILRGSNGRNIDFKYNEDEYISHIDPLVTKPDSLFKKFFETKLALEKKSEDNPLSDLISLYERVIGSTYHMQTNAAGTSQEMKDFEILADEVMKKYPVLKACRNFNRSDDVNIAQYINEKDA